MKTLIQKYKKLGPNIFIKKLLGFEPVFTCAIRKKNGKKLYEGGFDAPFYVLPKSKEYWYADPLIFEYDGHTILFMEALNYRTQKGKIVYSEIIDGNFSKPKTAISESFHLSFPNIFEFNNQLYMIPEAEDSGGIVIYQCENFPNKWRLITHIKTKVPIVDSIVQYIDGNIVHIISSTYDDDPLVTKYFYYQLDFTDTNNIEFRENEDCNQMSEYSYEYRNGGPYIEQNRDKKVHCIQKSTQAIYGYAIAFFPVCTDEKVWLDEKKEMLEVIPERIVLGNAKYKLMGIHTYSESKEYEVIDVEYFEWRFENWGYQFNKLKTKKCVKKDK